MSIDNDNGAVSLTCKPVSEVSVTVTGGKLDYVAYHDSTTGENDLSPLHITSASRLFAQGHRVTIDLVSGTDSDVRIAGPPFDYTCNGGPTQHALPLTEDGVTTYDGSCRGAILDGDYAIAATITG